MTLATVLPIHYAEVEAIRMRALTESRRAVCFTSALGGEGVTTVAQALAGRCAAAGQRVLLVDLNLANPALHRLYAQPRLDWHPGIAREALPIRASGVPGVDLLTAPCDDTLHWSTRDPGTWKALLEHWLQEYEFVIADTSPLLRNNRHNIPAEVVCAAFPSTVLVVLSGVTPEGRIAEANERLRDSGARLDGAILNDLHLPGLAAELSRETRRLDHLLPGTMARLRGAIARSSLLNQGI